MARSKSEADRICGWKIHLRPIYKHPNKESQCQVFQGSSSMDMIHISRTVSLSKQSTTSPVDSEFPCGEYDKYVARVEVNH
jgi:hypothetical protein